MSSTSDNRNGSIQRQNRIRRKPRKVARQVEKQLVLGSVHDKIPRSLIPASVFPVETYKTLRFVADLNVFTSTTDYVIYNYRLNSPYDCDFQTGGNQPTGFNTMMAAYNFVQVEAIAVKVNLTNNETTNLFAGLIFRDEQPSASITSRANVINAFGTAPCTRVYEMAASSGMDRIKFSTPKMSVGAIVGNGVAYSAQSLSYSCPANANPSQMVFLGLCIWTEVAGQVITTGATGSLEITMWCRFYSLRNVIA